MNALNKGAYNLEDYRSMLENINFPDYQLDCNVYNTVLKTDMVVTTDESGKRIKADEKEAFTK